MGSATRLSSGLECVTLDCVETFLPLLNLVCQHAFEVAHVIARARIRFKVSINRVASLSAARELTLISKPFSRPHRAINCESNSLALAFFSVINVCHFPLTMRGGGEKSRRQLRLTKQTCRQVICCSSHLRFVAEETSRRHANSFSFLRIFAFVSLGRFAYACRGRMKALSAGCNDADNASLPCLPLKLLLCSRHNHYKFPIPPDKARSTAGCWWLSSQQRAKILSSRFSLRLNRT